MARPSKYSDDDKREMARRVNVGGQSLATVCRDYGCTKATVMRYARLFKDAESNPPRHTRPNRREGADAPVEPSADDLPRTPDGEVDDLAILRQQQSNMYAAALEAKANGDLTTYQRLNRDASNLAPVIARVKKSQSESTDAVSITASEVREIEARLEEQFQALVERARAGGGLRCAKCHKELAIDLAQAHDLGQGTEP